MKTEELSDKHNENSELEHPQSACPQDELKETEEHQSEALEMDEALAENSVSAEEKPEKTLVLHDVPNYANMEKDELRNRLSLLVDDEDVDVLAIKDRVQAIKLNFYKKHNAELEVAKQKFIASGGAEEDFDFGTDETELQVRQILQKFKQKKATLNQKTEQDRELNLEKKYQVIEQIKALINRKEALHETFQEFRDLQTKWHEIGLVPPRALKNLWNNYHHHVERFYDYIKINKELKELDLRKNMSLKIKLCEEAENLQNAKISIVKAFDKLQKYHERWREVGPVPNKEKQKLWERFKQATKIINKNYQEHYDGLRSEQKNNLAKKTSLCEKAEEIANQEIHSHKKWNASSKQIINLQKEWKTIGYAPRKQNEKIYKRFRATCDAYFDKKRSFYAGMKEELDANFEKQKKLCEIAESLKNSTDWKDTTEKLIEIQKQWKAAGPVRSGKASKELWIRFRDACNQFFENKSEHFNKDTPEQLENLKKKEMLLEKLKACQFSDNDEDNLKILNRYQKEWARIGHVPVKKKKIQDAFKRSLDELYAKIKSDNKEVQKFKAKLDTFLEKDHFEDKIIVERNKIVNKIKQLEGEISLLENNVEFFSDSNQNSKIVADIRDKIEQGKQNLTILKDKLNVIDSLDS